MLTDCEGSGEKSYKQQTPWEVCSSAFHNIDVCLKQQLLKKDDML